MDSWKQQIISVENLLKKQRVEAFSVATALVAVHEDPEFLASPTIDGDQEKAIEYLDTFAVQLFVIPPAGRSPYLDLAAMLTMYPKKWMWEKADLTTMYEQVLDGGPEREEPSPTGKRRTVTLKMYDDLMAELVRLRAENDMLKARIAGLERDKDGLLRLAGVTEPVAA